MRLSDRFLPVSFFPFKVVYLDKRSPVFEAIFSCVCSVVGTE